MRNDTANTAIKNNEIIDKGALIDFISIFAHSYVGKRRMRDGSCERTTLEDELRIIYRWFSDIDTLKMVRRYGAASVNCFSKTGQRRAFELAMMSDNEIDSKIESLSQRLFSKICWLNKACSSPSVMGQTFLQRVVTIDDLDFLHAELDDVRCVQSVAA